MFDLMLMYAKLIRLTIHFHDVLCLSAVIKHHDNQSEGLSRRLIVGMIQTASGGQLTLQQAANCWDKTILPLGKKLGLLTGYVKPQEGTSKRTAAGSVKLQKDWYDVITNLFAKVRADALKVLNDSKLVELMMPILVANLDEECLHAMGKNAAIVGSKGKKKHDNQNASSRSVLIFFFALL